MGKRRRAAKRRCYAGESMHETSTFASADQIRADLAALTIQTTPEIAQEAINYIRANPDPALWTAVGPNCSSATWDVLSAVKLAHQSFLDGLLHGRADRLPWTEWESLIRQYNPSQNGKPQNGRDYGKPRYDMFELMWLTLPQSEPKATVTVTTCITGPDGKVKCTTQ